jgi:hypothetical protein
MPSPGTGNTIEHFAHGLARYWLKHHPEKLPQVHA